MYVCFFFYSVIHLFVFVFFNFGCGSMVLRPLRFCVLSIKLSVVDCTYDCFEFHVHDRQPLTSVISFMYTIVSHSRVLSVSRTWLSATHECYECHVHDRHPLTSVMSVWSTSAWKSVPHSCKALSFYLQFCSLRNEHSIRCEKTTYNFFYQQQTHKPGLWYGKIITNIDSFVR